MCGICGALGQSSGDAVRRMTAALAHRGPDAAGHYGDDRVALGVRRLRVIDLETGDQPIANEDGSVVVVFNGQIYNFRELRERLLARGHRFKSRTDTEVLVHLYEDHGTDLLAHLDGMFAFALWDRERQRLFLARDRLGEKPLYFGRDPATGVLYFASEIKALLASGRLPRRLSLPALDHYLSFRSVPAPLTALEDVAALRPAEALVVERGEMRSFLYWSPEPKDAPRTEPRAALAEELRQLLLDSVRRRMVADVPLGILLSGGLDSSLTLALARQAATGRLETFTVGFETAPGSRGDDERAQAREVATLLGTEHHEEVVSGASVEGAMDAIVWAMDQPTGDAIPHYFLYRAARRRVTVALCGTGGDELFAGYRWFRVQQRLHELDGWVRRLGPLARAPLALLATRSAFARELRDAKGSFAHHYAYTGTLFREPEKQALLAPEVRAELARRPHRGPLELIAELAARVEGRNAIAATSYVQLSTDLPSVLLRDTDAMSMAHSLEVRLPLLSHHVVELATSVPSRDKLEGGRDKVLLREVARPLLPAAIVDRPKQGFIAPMGHWMRHELRELVADALSRETTRRRGLFDPDAVAALHRKFQEDPREPYFKPWVLAVLELWQRRYLDDVRAEATAPCAAEVAT